MKQLKTALDLIHNAIKFCFKSLSNFGVVFVCLDNWLKQYITGLPPKIEGRDTNEKRQKYKDREDLINKEVAEHIVAREGEISVIAMQLFGIIDQKTSAMLTHISVMIAANALLLTLESSDYLNYLSVGLLVCLIATALLSLRLIKFWTNDEFPKSRTGQDVDKDFKIRIYKIFIEELYYRLKLYRITLNTVTLLTLISAILMGVYAYDISGENKGDEIIEHKICPNITTLCESRPHL